MFKISKIALATAAAAALTGISAAPAFASGGPSTNVPVSAELGTSIGFATLPTAVDFGAATLGGTTVVSSPVSIAGNITSYRLTIQPTGAAMTDSGPDQIANSNIFWFPASVNGMTGTSQGGWQDFGGDQQVWGLDPSGPSTQTTSNSGGNNPIINTGTMGSTGTGTINGEWALRLGINQAAGNYAETFTYSLSGS